MTELEILKGPEPQATGVWTEPSGMHYIMAMQTHAGIETLYMHAKWKKARPLSKGLKGEHVTAVAWQPDSVTESSTGYNPGAGYLGMPLSWKLTDANPYKIAHLLQGGGAGHRDGEGHQRCVQ